MKQKTAIRQLIEELEVFLKEHRSHDLDEGLMLAIELAEELESVNEQQIKDAFASAEEGKGFKVFESLKDESERYFNETFEKP